MSNKSGRKFGGRAKGTPNKITLERRQLLDLFLKDNFEEFATRFAAIENPVEYCRIYIQLLGFVIPRISSITLQEEKHQETLQEELDRICNGDG